MIHGAIIIITHMQRCANSARPDCPADCLGDRGFMWKANNYKCHNISEERRRQHDYPDAWLCQNCASPRESRRRLYCPKHGKGVGLAYRGASARNPEPVFLD